jgi:hypothetical protein
MSECDEIQHPELTALINEADFACAQATNICEAIKATPKVQAGLLECCVMVRKRMLALLNKLIRSHDQLCGHWQFPRATDVLLNGLAALNEAFALFMEKIHDPRADDFRAKASDIRRVNAKLGGYYILRLFQGFGLEPPDVEVGVA